MDLKLVFGANLRCVLHLFLEPAPFKGVMRPIVAKSRPQTAKNKTKMIVFPRGLDATETGADGVRVEVVRSHVPG